MGAQHGWPCPSLDLGGGLYDDGKSDGIVQKYGLHKNTMKILHKDEM